MEVKRLKISNVENIGKSNSYVYDVHMNNSPHTFFANNILVHNTDSCFFDMGGTFNQEWIDDFNADLKETFIPEYNNGQAGDYAMMEIEWEKTFDRIYFGDSKKRYYGMEKGSDKKYIKGLTIIRKDTPHFLADRMNEIIELSVTNGLTLAKLLDLRKLIEEQPYENIAVTKAYGKPFKQFKVKSGHVRGAEFANAILGTKINHKDTPYLFYIKSRCEDNLKVKDRHKTICILPEDIHFIDERSDLFEIDYDTYFDKQVIQQLKEFQHIEQVKEVLKEYKEAIKNAKQSV